MSEAFHHLGSAISGRWRQQGYDQRAFADCAAVELEAAQLPGALDITRWLLESDLIPQQVNIEASFGQPPITVFASDRFYIEVLYWLEGTPAIHQHGFSGAFRVLDGSSVHTEYEFTEEGRVNDRLLIGRLTRRRVDLLREGDVRRILPARATIHALFHLETPSVSVVARTYGMHTEPQYEYLPPHFAICPFTAPDSLRRRIQTVRLLVKLDTPATRAQVEELLQQPDFEQTVRALNECAALIPSWERVLALCDVARRTHGARMDLVVAVLDEARRRQRIVDRRASVTAPEHRFFLALLLTVPGRAEVLDLVRQRYPGRDPIAAVQTWTAELGAGALG